MRGMPYITSGLFLEELLPKFFAVEVHVIADVTPTLDHVLRFPHVVP